MSAPQAQIVIPDKPGEPGWFRRHLWGILVCLAFGLTGAIYALGLSGGWILDDLTNIVQNPALYIHPWSYGAVMHAVFSFDAGPLRRPISMLTFALNRTFFGPGPFSFKITNLALELLNGLLLLGFTRRLLRIGRTRWSKDWTDREIDYTALAVVAAWLLLPLNVTSVLYVVQREAALAATFTIAGAWFYLAARERQIERGEGWIPLTTGLALFLVLASLAKESGALLVAYVFLIEALLFRFRNRSGRTSRGILLFYLAFLVLPALGGLAWTYETGLLSYTGRPFTLGERLLSENRVVLHYIGWALLPNLADFTVFHHLIPSTGWLRPPSTLFSALALAALLVLAFLLRRKNPLMALGIGWFFVGQLMESTVFPLELVFEQRNYLADWGLVILVFSLLLLAEPRLRHRSARITVALLLMAFYASVTAQWTWAWRNNVALALDQATFHPHSPRATYFLGEELSDLTLGGDTKLYPAAVVALDRAGRLPNADLLPDAAKVILSQETGHPTEAQWFAEMEAKLRSHVLTVSDLEALQGMVNCETAHHCHLPPPWMKALFRAALESPRINELPFIKGNLLVLDGNWRFDDHLPMASIRRLNALAARLNPGVPQYRINLASIDLAMGNLKAARRDLALLQSMNWLGRMSPAIHLLETQIRNYRKPSPQATVKTHTQASPAPGHQGPLARRQPKR